MEIKNIIFDLGGVILDIDYQKTITAFQNLGFADFDTHYTQAKQSGVFDDLEVGAISGEEFINSLRSFVSDDVSNQQLVDAWNALLLPWNKSRVEFLSGLRNKYNLFLFSNTNVIHKEHFFNTFQETFGHMDFDGYFTKAYYSHEFGRRKPHKESFLAILEENNLKAEKTLFIDDSIQHIEGAKEAGLQTIHLTNRTILDLGL